MTTDGGQIFYNGLNMVSSRHLKLGYENKCLIGYSLYFVLAVVKIDYEKRI